MKRLLIALLLCGCTDAPAECGGQTLEALQATPMPPFKVVYTSDLPRGTRGRTVQLEQGGPAIIFIASDQNRISRDGALSHELACHVLHSVSHPPKPPKSNIAVPDHGRFWDRIRMGAPE